MNMHWVTAKLNLSGQGFYVLDILPTEPLSWPAAQVLMMLHGEENIYEIKPCLVSDTNVVREKERLMQIYGPVVDRVFPGRSPRMDLTMPGFAEDQPRCDNEGRLIVDAPSKPINGDDDEDEPEEAGREPPVGPAVFSPGRNLRPPAPGG